MHNYTENSAYTYSYLKGVNGSLNGILKHPYYGPYSIYDWPSYLISYP